MELSICLKNGLISTCLISMTSISWQSANSCLVFSFEDILSYRVSEISAVFLAFNRIKDKFKKYELRPENKSDLVKINELLLTKFTKDLRNYAIFLNPISGKKSGEKVFEESLKPLLDFCQSQYQVFRIMSSEYFCSFHCEDLIGFTHLIVLGGDGTMQELLTLVYQNDMLNDFAYGILPVGSQNALSCELSGKSLNSALLSVFKGNPQPCDLLKVSLDHRTYICTTAVSWGLVSDITDQAQHYRSFGPFRYFFTSFLRIFKPWFPFACDLKTLNWSKTDAYLTVLLGNHSAHSFYGNEVVFPYGNITDGFIDLQIVQFANRFETIQLFADMAKNGLHVKHKIVNYTKEKRVELVPHEHTAFNLDGEIKYGRHLIVEIMPKSVSFLRI